MEPVAEPSALAGAAACEAALPEQVRGLPQYPAYPGWRAEWALFLSLIHISEPTRLM
jgi:hypothetical protein